MHCVRFGCLILLLSFPLHAENLSESKVKSLLPQSSAWKELEAGTATKNTDAETNLSKYSVYGTGEVTYGESKQDPIINVAPVFNRTRSASLGVEKKFSFGVTSSVKAYTSQINVDALPLSRGNRTGAKVNITMDLASNFLGRIDRSKYYLSEASKISANKYDSFNKNNLILEVRKLYWNFITISDSSRLSAELLKTAEKQLKEILQKTKVGAADKGDLAQARSLVATRKNQLNLFQYQEVLLLKEIKNLLPMVNEVTPPDESAVMQQATSCVKKIATLSEPPETSLKEIAGILKKQKELALIEARASGDIDVQLYGEYDSNSIGTGFSGSYDNFSSDGKDAYTVGLTVKIPLSGEKGRLEKAKVKLSQNQYEAEYDKIVNRIVTTHFAAQKNIQLLFSALTEQRTSSDNLEIALKSARQKFLQARISLRDYINEQDKYFASKLDELGIRQQVINEVLGYSQVFDQFQCSFISI